MRLRPHLQKKKKFPGWAIALICAAVVLLAVLVLSFAGTAAFTVLRTGGAIFMTTRGAYETLGRSGFGSKLGSWRTSTRSRSTGCPAVSISSSRETDGVTFQEDYTGDVDDYRLRYTVEDGKLVISPAARGPTAPWTCRRRP